MSDLDWADVTEVTHDEAKQDLLDFLAAQGFTTTSFQEGDPELFGVEVGSEIWRNLSLYALFLRDMAFNETATGEALRRLSQSRFGNTQNEAVAAQRQLTLACAAGSGPYNINLGDIVIEDSQGHTIRNIAGLSVSYPASLPSGGTLTLLFEAEVPGAASNVANDSYTFFVTTLAGVTVTDDTAYRLGEDKESVLRLRARNSSKIATRSLEPIADTIENLILEAVPTIYSVKGDYENPRGQATFDVYLAGQLATATASEVATAQAALDARVFGDTSGLPNTRPGYAIAAPTLALDIVGTVYFDPRFAQADVGAAVTAALVEFLKATPIGGFDYSVSLQDVVPKNEIENAIRNTLVGGQSGAIKTVSLTTPSGDVAVSSLQKVVQGTWTLTYTASST